MKDVKNSLTFDVTKTPGKKMMENLMAAMQTKLHQLFLDPTVNSIRTVEINLQDSFASPEDLTRLFLNCHHVSKYEFIHFKAAVPGSIGGARVQIQLYYVHPMTRKGK